MVLDRTEIKNGSVKNGGRTKTKYQNDRKKVKTTNFFEHVMRHDCTIIIHIMKGKTNGKRGRERPSETNLRMI